MSLPEDKHSEDVPSNYFKQLNLSLNEKLIDEDIFNEQDYPLLFSLKSEQDFSIPQDYLRDFDPSINIAQKSGSRFNKMLIAASILIAVCLFALSIKKEAPQSNDINSVEILKYFAEEETIELDPVFLEDIEGLSTLETENRFTYIEEEILLDYLIEDSDQIDLALLY